MDLDDVHFIVSLQNVKCRLNCSLIKKGLVIILTSTESVVWRLCWQVPRSAVPRSAIEKDREICRREYYSLTHSQARIILASQAIYCHGSWPCNNDMNGMFGFERLGFGAYNIYFDRLQAGWQSNPWQVNSLFERIKCRIPSFFSSTSAISRYTWIECVTTLSMSHCEPAKLDPFHKSGMLQKFRYISVFGAWIFPTS